MMNLFAIFTTVFLSDQLILLCDCSVILKPQPITQTSHKGVPDSAGPIAESSGSFGPLSEPLSSGRVTEFIPDLLRVDPSKCEPSIFIAPVLNISTQTIEKKLAALNRQVQLLSEQVRILTSRETPSYNPELRNLPPRDCKDVLDGGFTRSGAYVIQPEAIGRPIKVFCDLETDGGGWTVFQRRFNGSESFRRSWPMYRRGFGDVTTEFWLGLDNLHRITAVDEFELRVELQDFDDIKMTSSYSWMRVDDVTSGFKLHLGSYSGIAGDALSPHNGQQFSTHDRDNDALKNENCSVLHGGGGWWFENCLETNPNGLYLGGVNRLTSQGIVWNTWKGPNYSLKRIEMKLRPSVGD